MEKYSPQSIEKKWQSKWLDENVYKTEMDEKRPKYYALEMFPYPSGNLHMGHVRNYSIGDVLARFKTMEGYNVLHPMGFDSFGMPAENAAIKHGVKPSDWTYSNIDNMKRQQREMGLSYDWDREVLTCRQDYYRWTQWIFQLFYKKGLAYKKKAYVNWCDTCGTVLANEQVEDGKCWRCDSEVVKKDLSQWFLKITDYADELLKDLDKLQGWPERVRIMQENWIGRSEGLEFELEVPALGEKIAAYTTRPDTVYGITFLALAAEHPLVEKICEANPEKAEAIRDFVKEADTDAMNKKAIEDNKKKEAEAKESKPIKLTKEEVEQKTKELQAAEKKRIGKLSRLYNEMKPDEAAKILTALDDEMLISILQKMDESQVSQILANEAFGADRAADITRKMYAGTPKRVANPNDEE